MLSILLALAVPLVQTEPYWPHWRGPTANGVAPAALPRTWSDTEHVRWKVEVPGRGVSTPIVLGERLFLTTAVPGDAAAPIEPQSFELHCLDRASGKTLWRSVAKVATPHEGFHKTYGSFASSSPITDGERVYVSFGSQGVHAFDLEGKLLWSHDLGVKLEMRKAFGEGHALVLAGDALVQVCDQESGSFAFAVDRKTGQELWRVERDEPSTWATPLVTRFGDALEVVTAGARRTRSYDAATGKILWEAPGAGANVIPTVLRHGDTVLTMSGFTEARILALRPVLADGAKREGDVPVAWTTSKGCGYTASPVLHDGLYYTVTDSGRASCFDAETGKAHYLEERLPRGSSLKASPIAAGEILYVPTEAGEVHLVRLGPKFEVVATNVLADQMFIASPAAAEGRLYLRSMTHLFCIGDG